MKKVLIAAAVLITGVFSAFAGDAAYFDDIGFSQDGKYYIFGTYGKTDRTYEPWAEIYTVDVAANNFVKNDVFKTKEQGEVSGKKAYENLKASSEWKLSKYGAQPSDVSNLLYLRESEKKSSTDEIVFKDFENSTESSGIFYHIKLVPTYSGSGKSCKSKFYINMVRKDENGNVLSSQKVGTPDFERKGITGYQIDKIFTDKSGKSIVFIIQKTLEDDNGTSIRYMVETVRN